MSNLMSMKKTFRPYQPNQQYLLPPSLRDWLPDDHPVHFINEVVDGFDLSAIYDDYRERRGQPPYDPRMMVKILIYAMTKGIHSSRKIERALYEDIGLRYLSADQQPDHWTISDFRRRHLKALGDLLVQTVQMAQRAGLIRLNHVAIDGTKIKANASKHSAMSYARMEKEEKRLREEVQRLLERMERNDQKEDELYGDSNGYSLPKHLATAQGRLEAIAKAKAELEAEAREKAERKQAERKEKAEKQGKTHKPRKDPKNAKPKARDQRNFTDADSRIMRNSDKAFIQGYNAQAAVDAQTQIIVAADLTNQAGDCPHLQSQVEQVKRNTGQKPKEVSADAGYYSDDNVQYLMGQGIIALIPPDKVKHSEWRNPNPPRGRMPKNMTVKDLIRRMLRTRRGRKRYKLRQTSIEPTFGNIKEQIGLRQFLLRGLSKVRPYWRFTCAVHNILKLFRAGVRLTPALGTR